MNQITPIVLNLIDELESAEAYDTKLAKMVRERISAGKLTRAENPPDHFCAFFLPIHQESKSIYLVHHKKAQDWIPPGGHIELNEHPVDTVIRESQEELGLSVTPKQVKPFFVDYIDISNPGRVCQRHYHIWYALQTDIEQYRWDTKEFYNAGWFGYQDGLKQIASHQTYRNVIGNFLRVAATCPCYN